MCKIKILKYHSIYPEVIIKDTVIVWHYRLKYDYTTITYVLVYYTVLMSFTSKLMHEYIGNVLYLCSTSVTYYKLKFIYWNRRTL